MKKLLIAIVLAFPISCFAFKWSVGPTRSDKAPSDVANRVNDGDTIEIDGGVIYPGDVCSWAKNDLVIIGVNGRPHLRADGQNALGKGIWVISGNNVRVENIEFSGAVVPDENGAGIRAEGTGLHIVNCYFHDNENGILTNPTANNLKVEYSEFEHNGVGELGQTHNIYIGNIDTAIVRFNYFHRATIGHEFKSRATVNYILYNRFSNESDGTASRNIDIPDGGVAYIVGNIIEKGPNADNNNMVGYDLEKLPKNPGPHILYIVNNTFVNNRTAGGLFLDVDVPTETVKIYNNIFSGPGTILDLTGSSPIVDSSNNLVQPNISLVGFSDAANYNYTLTETSPAINGGTDPGTGLNGFSLMPVYEYVHPAKSKLRVNSGVIDIGAYEFLQALPLKLVTFAGNANGDDILIQWKTETEQNIQAFQLEKSINGISFETITTITADNNTANNYSYIDAKINAATNYYRLKITENGSSYFSKTIVIKKDAYNAQAKASVSSNTLRIFQLPDAFKGNNAQVHIYDYSGRQLFQQNLNVQNNSVTASLKNIFTKGQYLIVSLRQKDNSLVIPVVVQ